MSIGTSEHHVDDPLPAAAAIPCPASASQECCGEEQRHSINRTLVAACDMEDGGAQRQQAPADVSILLSDALCSLPRSPAWGSSSSSPSPPPPLAAESQIYGATSVASAAASAGEAVVELSGGKCNGVHGEEVPVHDDAASSTTTSLVRVASSSSSVNMQEAAAGVLSPCSNEPFPIMEEAGVWTDLDKVVEEMGEELCLEEEEDFKPSSEDAALRTSFLHNSTSCRAQTSCSEDAFMSELDELLHCDTTGFLNDSSLPCVDDFLPEFSATHEVELPPPTDPACLEQWNMDSSQECDLSTAASSLPDFSHVAGSTDDQDGGEESVTQLFAQWLKSNAHRFSLNDLKKIKLKTSTIESATRRLGGGKKGLSQFLRFVLIWIQNCHVNQGGAAAAAAASALGSCSATIPPNIDGEHLDRFSPVSSSATSKLGYAVRDGHVLRESSPILFNQGTRPVWNERITGVQSELYPNTNKRVQLSDPRESSWNSMSCSNQWRLRESNGQSLPLHDQNRFTMATSTPGTVEHTGWHRQQQGNSAVMCGGLPAGQDCLGVYNPVPQAIAPNSTSFSQSIRPCTPAATTRAARKSRMERQRWSVRRHHQHAQRNKAWATSTPLPTASPPCATPSHATVSSVTAGSCSIQTLDSSHTLSSLSLPRASARNTNSYLGANPSTVDLRQQGRKAEKNLRLLFQKELKQSDVGSLGRIVLPKAAETSLPPLELRDGVNLVVEDLSSSKVWNMRYRFWPNNKSRMYLLENTGDFVKSYDLKEGDYMTLYYSSSTNRYMIKGAKAFQLNNFAAVGGTRKVNTTAGAPSNTKLGKLDSARPMSTDIFASDDSYGDDTLFAELIEQSLEDVDDLPDVLDLTA